MHSRYGRDSFAPTTCLLVDDVRLASRNWLDDVAIVTLHVGSLVSNTARIRKLVGEHPSKCLRRCKQDLASQPPITKALVAK